MTPPSSLDERFRAAAVAEGLLDAGYDVIDSPVGPLFLAATPRGVCRISYDADPERQE
jgi:methylated-DNA-[protein]-cysteine S-methyltransferase